MKMYKKFGFLSTLTLRLGVDP